jgi:hypothetical protein
LPGEPVEFKGWDGFKADSLFSGILVKLDPEDPDMHQVATIIS